jgi:hypothetical protein
MKKLFLIFLLTGGLQLMAQQVRTAGEPNQELRKQEVPSLVTDNFIREFPAAEPTWSRDGENYKALFINVETRLPQVVVYNQKGEVVRREGHHDLPSKTDSLEVKKK